MAIPPRTTASGTFFITTITYNRRRLFQLPANAELFLDYATQKSHADQRKDHAKQV
jgi:hypothetical protein